MIYFSYILQIKGSNYLKNMYSKIDSIDKTADIKEANQTIYVIIFSIQDKWINHHSK